MNLKCRDIRNTLRFYDKKRGLEYMRKMKLIALFAIFVILSISMYMVFNTFIDKTFQGKNGLLDLKEIENKEVINVNGEFLVADGILYPEKMMAYVSNEGVFEKELKRLTYNGIRKYSYPEDSITAYMKIQGDLSNIDGIIIEEIYSAANIFINGELVTSLGHISEDGVNLLMSKESRLIMFEEVKELELIIQISNPEHIGGQLEKHLFIGEYDALFEMWNKRLLLKSIQSVFYFTMGLVLLGLFIRNKKHLFLLSLGIAGILNSYIILTYFEPFILFVPKGNLYLINSYLQAFPTLVTQYLSALSIILFIKNGIVYKFRKKFIPISMLLLIISIIYITLVEQAADSFYIILLFTVMTFLMYALGLLSKMYVLGEKRGAYLYLALLIYVLSYGLLIGISLSDFSFGIFSKYPILLMTGQFAFYLMMSYFIITDFSRQFYLTEINENYLDEVVKDKTGQLLESIKLLEKEDASRRRLLSDISHDLRSPITVVKGYVELINSEKIEEEKQKHYMNIILKKVNYIGDLVENILFLARVEQGKSMLKDIESLDLIIHDVVDSYRDQSHEIKCELLENMLFECDYGQIKRLFANLIDNAMDYSPEGSTIYINGQIENDNYVIKIEDKGIGIDEKNIEQIFSRFVRVDSTRNNESQHFGLGLAIVKSIVIAHKGEIRCESILGEGTTFTLYFPINRGEI